MIAATAPTGRSARAVSVFTSIRVTIRVPTGRTRLGFNVRASARRRFYRAPPALFTMKVSPEESAGEDVDAGVHPDDAVLLMRGEAGGQGPARLLERVAAGLGQQLA